LPDPEQTVYDTIRMLLKRKSVDTDVTADSVIDDLGLESLDVAELSAILEDDLGRDPYSAGFLPETVGQLVDWYKS
jgi:acyl carrier protein